MRIQLSKMSQIQTAPELNPTVIEQHPTQEFYVKPLQCLKDFGDDEQAFKKFCTFQVQTLGPSEFSAMEKDFKDLKWVTTSGSYWTDIELTPLAMAPLLSNFQSNFQFFQFDSIQFRLRTTLNAYMQGLSVFSYDPAPTVDFYKTFYDINILEPKWYTQLKYFTIEPNKDTTFGFNWPQTYPFRYYTTKDYAGTSRLKNYPMGRFRATALSPLTTKSTEQTITYVLRAFIENATFVATTYPQ